MGTQATRLMLVDELTCQPLDGIAAEAPIQKRREIESEREKERL